MDTPKPSSAEAGTKTVPPQTNAVSEEGGSQSPPYKQRKRPCGAEIKRRKRARQAASAQARAPVCTSTPQKVGAAPQQGLAPRANPSSGGRPAQKPHRPVAKGVGRLDPKGKSQTQPSTARPEKRPRTDGSGHSQGLNPRKKACPAQGPKISYREAATSNLRVAIINRSVPMGKVTPEQTELIKGMLHRRLDETLFTPGGSDKQIPTFGGLRVAGEILRITCDNEHTLNWLSQTVHTAQPLWDGAQLKVIQEDQIPKMWKVSIWIPGESEEPELVLARLGAQNPNLEVGTWCTFHTAATGVPPGRLLVMGVGEKAARVLNQSDGGVKYRLTTLKARITKDHPVSEAAAVEVGPPPMEGTPPL